jgi:septal ring factor EnvC (AmiA/AmiB activator)
MIEDKIKTHRRNLQMLSGIDRQIKELQSAIFNFYTENEVVQDKKNKVVQDIAKLRQDLEDVRRENYEITKAII